MRFSLLILGVVWILLSGCGGGRQSRASYNEGTRMDISLSDTLIRQRLYQGLQNKKVMFRAVLLSPPDTLERQYVQRIVELQSVEEHTYEGKDSVMEQRSLQADIVQQKEETSVTKTTGSYRRAGLILSSVLVALVCFLLFLYFCRNKLI